MIRVSLICDSCDKEFQRSESPKQSVTKIYRNNIRNRAEDNGWGCNNKNEIVDYCDDCLVSGKCSTLICIDHRFRE